jgi:hypothetical protein
MDGLLIDKHRSLQDRSLIALAIVGIFRDRAGKDIGNAMLLNALTEFLMDAVSRFSILERRLPELEKEIAQLKNQPPAKSKKH